MHIVILTDVAAPINHPVLGLKYLVNLQTPDGAIGFGYHIVKRILFTILLCDGSQPGYDRRIVLIVEAAAQMR
jgi:hypothetical protein